MVKKWRPSKLKNFIVAFKKVLENNEWDVIYLTDNELIISCNNLLEKKYRIRKSTFENRKAGIIEDCEEYHIFLGLYKNALINQKRELFKAVNKWENNWQSRAWIIERKFSAWNLRNISEVKTKQEINILDENKLRQLEDLKNKIENKSI